MAKERSKYQLYSAAQRSRKSDENLSADQEASTFRRYSPLEGGTQQEYKEWRKSEKHKGTIFADQNGALSFKGWLDKQKDDARANAKNASSQIAGMQSQIASLQSQLKKQAGAAPKPKGDMQIDPVQSSSEPSAEVSSARQVVNDYQSGLQNQKSPWEQAQAEVNSSGNFGNFNPGGKGSSTPDAQDFADKYKLNLISSGATQQNQTDFTAPGTESRMSTAEILKRDKQLYG